MPTTRSKSKGNDNISGAPPSSKAQPGSKHKTPEDDAPKPKRAKTSGEKSATQQTREATIDKKSNGNAKKGKPVEVNSEDEPDAKARKTPSPAKKTENGSAVKPHARRDSESVPSSILEKGIIYFFFRGRVNTDEPSSVDDIARSFILLRPIERDAKLGSGPIGDAGNSRLIAIPKKVLPRSGRDRWIAFVEKTGASFQQLKDEFLASNDYVTKTAGARHTPSPTPIGEGIYAITSTGKDSHLVYFLTLPEKLGEVQSEIGLKDRGSFIISTRNPGYPAPASARLPKDPDYPKELHKEFRSLRWVATQPKHLDYVNTQFLMIGESSGTEKALEPQKKDQKKEVAEPEEELEKLEEENARRMKGLSEDVSNSIFADLQVHAKDYPKLQTTF